VSLRRDRLYAVLEALFVTFLWSSSYVLVKVGLQEIGPLTLVAYRYTVASLVLLPLALSRGHGAILRERGVVLKLGVLGLLGYTVAQGLQVLGLFLLPAVSVTFLLNFTPITVLALGVLALNERPTLLQLAGIVLAVAGAALFFNDPLASASLSGVLVSLLSGVGWGAYIVLGRRLSTDKIPVLGLTAFSMAGGTVLLLASAFVVEGFAVVSAAGWGIILWLGVVNTALAFFMWNRALGRLEAIEISVLQNTMLIQIAVLAWVFLGERFTVTKVPAMALVFLGALIVQLRK
jgi:drug/metabolite transporter (DMT)-like permease